MNTAQPNFFYVNRALLQSDRWLSEPFTRGQAWVDLFGLAQHRDSFFRVRGIRVDVKRGQLAYSQLTLAKRWKWSRNKLFRYLNELEKHGDIVQQNNNITTIITIVKYDMWQGNDTADDTPERHQKDTRRVTYKNVKNVKNDNNSDVPSQDIQSFINLFKSINTTYERLFGNKTERLCAERLVKKFGLQKMESMFVQLPDILNQPYAPRITTPYELEKNLGKLIQFIEQNKNKTIINKPKVAFT